MNDVQMTVWTNKRPREEESDKEDTKITKQAKTYLTEWHPTLHTLLPKDASFYLNELKRSQLDLNQRSPD